MNRNASGVDQWAATTGERPTTATTHRFQISGMDRRTEERQGVHQPDAVVDELVVVVVPPDWFSSDPR